MGKGKKKHQHDATSAVTSPRTVDRFGPARPAVDGEDEEQAVRGRDGAPARGAGGPAGVGEGQRRQDLHRVRGPDTAGKGGTIKRITERVSPRVFRIAALPAPTPREASQMYMQRYVAHFPAAGEVVIFDRSWYNRAGVEPVMGFCTPEQTDGVPGEHPRPGVADDPLRHHLDQVLAGGQPGRADPAAEGSDERSAQDLEAVGHGPAVLQPLVRLLPRPRRHVRRHRHRLGALARGGHRRQEAGPPQHHHPPARARCRTSRWSVRRSSCRDGSGAGGYVESDRPKKYIPTPF